MQDKLGIRQAASTPGVRWSSPILGHWRRNDGRYMRAAIDTGEQWVTKQQLAAHLQVTRRWIENQQQLGLPFMRMGGMNRYIRSEVDAWLIEHYGQGRRAA